MKLELVLVEGKERDEVESLQEGVWQHGKPDGAVPNLRRADYLCRRRFRSPTANMQLRVFVRAGCASKR
jgi:hypothetical protein